MVAWMLSSGSRTGTVRVAVALEEQEVCLTGMCVSESHSSGPRDLWLMARQHLLLHS